MTDQTTDITEETELSPEQRVLLDQETSAAKPYGQSGDRIDPGLGNMGGAGASGGIQPDIGRQSWPAAGNSSDNS